jgi:hypothetical protein
MSTRASDPNPTTAPAERPGAGPSRAAALTLSLLVAALIAQASLWPRAAWLVVPARDRPALERALAGAAAAFSGTTSEDLRWTTRSDVERSAGRVCVTLASTRGPDHGYRECRDARTGELVEERAWVE